MNLKTQENILLNKMKEIYQNNFHPDSIFKVSIINGEYIIQGLSIEEGERNKKLKELLEFNENTN